MHWFLEDLVKDHARIRRILELFAQELVHLRNADNADLELLQESLDYCRKYLDGYHHKKEDVILEVLQDQDPDTATKLEDLSRQHIDLAALTLKTESTYLQIRDGAEFLRETLYHDGSALKSAYEAHLSWDEEQFFPIIDLAFELDEWVIVISKAKQLNSPDTQDPPEWRFHLLADELKDEND